MRSFSTGFQDASVVENDKVVIGLLNAANIEDYVDAFKNSINKRLNFIFILIIKYFKCQI